jgi:acetolactate synthase-1/2/3 large subunit
MKLSDYVAFFFAELGVRHAFVVTGGASLHLIHSIHNTENIDYVCCHHEQSAAMSADAYARVTNHIGLAIATSGPGATNLITGICGCFYDSVPAVFITGQVSTFRLSGASGVRQTGFQETPITEMCRPVTKYVTQILNPRDIKRELQKAIFIAKSVRPGPVLIDIPDDIQRTDIEPEELEGYSYEAESSTLSPQKIELVEDIINQLKLSKRPVIVAGWGLHLAKCEVLFLELVNKLGVPVVLTWGASDILPDSHSLKVGTFGTHGNRYANFTIQNSDFVLVLGSRLDTKSTGTPVNTFARQAWKAVVDIDQYELDKFEKNKLKIDCLIQHDAKGIIDHLLSFSLTTDFSLWLDVIRSWKTKYSYEAEKYTKGIFVDPYQFVDVLSKKIQNKANIFVDTGSAIAWMMQAFKPGSGHRVWHDFNNTAMGWAVPASIASAFAENDVPVYCIVGDGSLMMNIQELATIVKHNLNIKVICFDNNGYSMIQQTQDQWLDSQYIASSETGGLGMPNLLSVAKSFGMNGCDLSENSEIETTLVKIDQNNGPYFCRVKIDQRCRVVPQVKFGRPNEDSEPLLPRDTFFNEMIIPILDVSKGM